MVTLSTRHLFLEGGRGSTFIRTGRLEIYARRPHRLDRWAWLAFVKEGPSVEMVAGPFTVTASWGIGGTAHPPARVWAWRRARKAGES